MVATDVNFEKLKELKEERPAVEIDQLDVTKRADVEQMFKEKYVDVNVLFNCAGYVRLCVSMCMCICMLCVNALVNSIWDVLLFHYFHS